MIAINLLPPKRRARRGGIRAGFFWIGVAVCLMLSGMGGGYWAIHAQHTELENIKNERLAIKSRLLVQVAKVKKLKKICDKLETHIAALRTIRVRQALPVRYMDEMVACMPAGKIWLERLTLNGQNRIELQGMALDNQVFARYVEGLRQSPFIVSVITRQTRLRPMQDMGLVEFVCSISVAPPRSKEDGNG